MALTLMTIPNDVVISGNFSVRGSFTPLNGSITNAAINSDADIDPGKMAQRVLAKYGVPLTSMRVHDAMHTLLPSAGAADDLGIVGGTFGTNTPTLKTSDAAGASIMQYARFTFTLPPEYETNETVKIRLRAGMETTIADILAFADVSCYKSDLFGGLGSDLVTTAATGINSLTDNNYDFDVTASGLSAGDELDCRIFLQVQDTATVTVVTASIGSVSVLCDTRG